jgi:hypothetical protein
MGASLKFDGMAELRAALHRMPEELANEARDIIGEIAYSAAGDIRSAYPSRTGNLIRGVVVTRVEKGKLTAGAVVKSGAPHAHLFEYGTSTRHNRKGANRGAMPKPPEQQRMIPIIQRARRRMYALLADMLRRHGFLVEAA